MSVHSARSPAYLKARARILATATVCHICGGQLDRDAPPKSPNSPSIDHVLPMSKLDPDQRAALEADPSLLRPAHLRCNSSRGNRMARRPVRASRRW